MLSAILYVETAAPANGAYDRLRSEDLLPVSLSNCKHLVYDLPWGAFLVHVDCSEVDSLNQAVIQKFSGLEGVKRVTTLIVKDRQ